MLDKSGGGGKATRGAMIGVGALIMAVVAALQVYVEDGRWIGEAPPPAEEAEARRDTPARAAPSEPASPARAERRDLPFDYYVLALSWSPSFCVERPDADQCGQRRRLLLHGLWPNHEDGSWENDCETRFGRPSEIALARYAPLSASAGLLAYQWRKHGTCSGLGPDEYLATAAEAYRSIAQPEVLDAVDRDLEVAPTVIEEAFLEANPQLSRDGVTIRCDDGRISEIRICLTPDLEPRDCAGRAAKDCRRRSATLPAPK